MGSSSLSRKWDKISLDVSGFRMASIVMAGRAAAALVVMSSADPRVEICMLLAACWLLAAWVSLSEPIRYI